MVLAVSRFRVVNSLEEEVAAAFRSRPHLVDRASGFLGMEVFRDCKDLRIFYLVTRWSDERSFREWHGSEAHRRSHEGIPAGLRLDPSFTEVVTLERIEEPDSEPHPIADLGLLLDPFLKQADGTLLLCCAADGTILACNPAARDLLGPTLLGRLLWDHVTTSDAERLRARIAAVERRPEERFRLNVCDSSHVVHTVECHLDLRPDGFILVGERDFSGMDRLQGELLALNKDLALMARERGQALARAQRAEREHERLLASAQQARAEAEEANRRKDDILAMVSHDLRTPLGAIIGWSRLLASGRLGQDETTRAVEAIQRNAEVQANLVEDLLDLARARTGKLRFKPRPIDPAQVVESILEAARPAAEAKGVSLQCVTGGSALLLLADPTRLEQALGNLVTNAVKFTPAGGRVEVRLEGEGDFVAIRVQDTGEGIDLAFLPYIFDRYRQGQGTGTERTSGLGLGLAIARDLIELQGGTIEAASDGPGRGTTFTVRLPAQTSSAPAH